MLGPEEVTSGLINDCTIAAAELQEKAGIIPQSIFYLFERLTSSFKDSVEFSLKCSYLEIYNESINDLLASPPAHNLKIREFPHLGMCVIGSTEKSASCPQDVFACLARGTLNRITGATELNQRSSRSHTLFILTLDQKSLSGSTKHSRLNLVDLAGSEKVSKTGAVGQALREAQNINLSLTTLGRCIKALSSAKEEHIPFRESKLTMILKESLGGNAKTVLICAVSQKQFHVEEGKSTLKFAERAKLVQTKARTNVKRSPEELLLIIEQLKAEIAALKRLLKGQDSPSYRSSASLEEDLTVKYAELKAQYESLNESAQYEIEQLKAKIEQLRELALRFPLQIQEQQDQIEEVNIRLSAVLYEKENMRKGYEAEVAELQSRWEVQGRELEIVRKEKEGTAVLLGKAQEEVFEKEQELEKTMDRLQLWEAQMKADAEKLCNLRETNLKQGKLLEELTKDKLDLQKSLSILNSKESAMQTELVNTQSALNSALREAEQGAHFASKVAELEANIRQLTAEFSLKEEACNRLVESAKRNSLDYKMQILSLTAQLDEGKRTSAGKVEAKQHSAQAKEMLSRVMKEMSDFQGVYQDTVLRFRMELARAQTAVEEGKKRLEERDAELSKALQSESAKAAEYSKSWKLALIEQDSLKFLASKVKADLATANSELLRERGLRLGLQTEVCDLKTQLDGYSKAQILDSSEADTTVAKHRLKAMKRQYRMSMHDSEVQLIRYTAENSTLAEALAAKENEMRVQASRIRELESHLREVSSKAQRVEQNLWALRKRTQSSLLGVVVHSDLLLMPHLSYSSQSSCEEDRPSHSFWQLPHRDLYGLQDIQPLYSNDDMSDRSVCCKGTEDSQGSDQEVEDLLE